MTDGICPRCGVLPVGEGTKSVVADKLICERCAVEERVRGQQGLLQNEERIWPLNRRLAPLTR